MNIKIIFFCIIETKIDATHLFITDRNTYGAYLDYSIFVLLYKIEAVIVSIIFNEIHCLKSFIH